MTSFMPDFLKEGVAFLVTIGLLVSPVMAQTDSVDFGNNLIHIGVDFSAGALDYAPLQKDESYYVYTTFTYSTGISVDLNLGKFLGLGFGVRYSNEVLKADQRYPSPYLPYDFIEYTTKNHYLDFPILLNMYSKPDVFRFVGSVGIQGRVHFSEYDSQVFYHDNGDEYHRVDSPWSPDLTPEFSIVSSAGVEYRPHKRIAIRLSPYFRIRLVKGSKPYKQFLWSSGGRLGVYYCFQPKL